MASICQGPLGDAEYGLRYISLTDSLGPDGFSYSLCSTDGIGGSLQDLAQRLVPRVFRICLPESVDDPASLRVVHGRHRADGEDQTTLTSVEDFDVEEASSCPSGSAIRFHEIVPMIHPQDRLLLTTAH